MTVLLHDYAGHPFTIELARELAQRGHQVTYAWFGADIGPKGELKRRPHDTAALTFTPITIASRYSKKNLFSRRFGDVRYGRQVAALVDSLKPDIVISGNTPTEAQQRLVEACMSQGVAFVYWCQDFYSVAVTRLLSKRVPVIGHGIGAYYQYLERRQMRAASRIVLITDAFLGKTRSWEIPDWKVETIPNWGVVDQIDVLPRETDWANEMGLTEGPRFLYSGTLAMKHNPDLLLGLAQQLRDGELVVVSSGVGADYLRRMSRRQSSLKLRVLPPQPFKLFPEVLASADVLLAVIEREAGGFSVPSKVLSYLCAGRPIVLAAPRDNLAAQIVLEAGAGVVVDPEDGAGFVEAAQALWQDAGLRRKCGMAGRAYAEKQFDIVRVADRFEGVFRAALGASS